jgi:hypothetical protein
MTDDDECGAIDGMFGNGNRNTRRKPALVLLYQPQIPRDLIDFTPGPPQWKAGD